MNPIWDKGLYLDEKISRYTIGTDQSIDTNFILQDIIGSLGHILTLHKSKVLSAEEVSLIGRNLINLYKQYSVRKLEKIEDEDIHSFLERVLIENLGSIGKKVHTARSRNDQIATDINLWIKDQVLIIHQIGLQTIENLSILAEKEKDTLMLGMTHLQPAMPSSVGAWAAGYASLFLDDIQQLSNVYRLADVCPLGSAAGYGVPEDLICLDREYTSEILGFSRPIEPVTSVQCGRGKIESTFLHSASQISATCSRLARDLILFVNPQFDFFSLPITFTTGSSIMPQKRNPDVMELIRSSSSIVNSCLMETLSIASSVNSGYHRDFQRIKEPLLRGINLAKESLEMICYVIPNISINYKNLNNACPKEINATYRALELVLSGLPFRDAYKTVGKEVLDNSLPNHIETKVPSISKAISQIEQRFNYEKSWQDFQSKQREEKLNHLFSIFVNIEDEENDEAIEQKAQVR